MAGIAERTDTLEIEPTAALVDTAAETLLDEFPEDRIHVAVHDSSRLAWNASVPVPSGGRLAYELMVELEVPTNLVGPLDPWEGLQSYARLDGSEDNGGSAGATSPEDFRRDVSGVSFKLARARNGFVRHCTLVRSSTISEEEHVHPLVIWISAARTALALARVDILNLASGVRDRERALADEFLSVQLWSVLTDCARALADAQRALLERSEDEGAALDSVEQTLSEALREEIAYRRKAGFTYAEPANVVELERLVSRLSWLKKHFERVLFLQVESYQVVNRLASWFSAAAAMLAYLWFFFWQLALERHRSSAAIGSGVIMFALVTAVAYASRERLKESGRNWLAGRAQSMFAQRVTRYRLPTNQRRRGAVVVAARESFSQSGAHRPDPVNPEGTSVLDVTVLRFSHRGFVARPEVPDGSNAARIRLVFRLDLSPLLPRLHDAVRGFASPHCETGRIVILDVPRNYELPVRAGLRVSGTHDAIDCTLVLNKNGLCRIEERPTDHARNANDARASTY